MCARAKGETRLAIGTDCFTAVTRADRPSLLYGMCDALGSMLYNSRFCRFHMWSAAVLTRHYQTQGGLEVTPATWLQERIAILRLQAAGLPLDSSVNLPGLAVACHGYSGADLVALCRQAAMVALTEAAGAFLSGGS